MAHFSDRLELNCCPARLRMKDYVMETVTTVQENASDILASAKDLNEERAAKEAEEAAAAQLETSEEE